MIPKLVTAYQGEECLELSLENSGPVYAECSCGSLYIEENSKGRAYCGSCGKFARKESEFGCAICFDYPEAEIAEEVKALLFPDGKLRTIEDYLIICEEVGKPTTMLFWVF